MLLLSAAHPPDDIRVVRKEGAALAEAGWRIRHLAPGGAAPPAVAGVALETYRRAPGWRGRLLGILPLARRAAASGARVIHASEPDAWFAALLAARRSGARVVIDVHEHYPSRLDGKLPSALRPLARGLIRLACRAAGRLADAVVVAKDGLAGDFGPHARIVPVRNYGLPCPVTPRRHALGPVTLVHAGALGRSRGWPQMLAALARCPPGTRLRLIGRFTDGSEAEFHAEAARLGLTDRIETLPWMPHAEAMARLAEADIALVLFQPGEVNHTLALPHKLFDAMLAGLPVIAPDFATEVAAVLRTAGCGELVPTGDAAAIAAAVARLGCPARRQALGEAGRAAALGPFSWAAEAERLVALYRALLGCA
ncbi:glycosyltransferase [Siccirubricoccus sp. KC 17139]|uniref:Glycosyltransferase n=1 Tax=Siccirubricoccus soli TaxID=2899147 RepID=A0ABT1DCN8_9PROT|nr:glycosyltransferase [Siccirubricoccus soli]MCP2685809.1 glycosyltransferase [Siccirubricoccus soli]